MPFPLLKIIGGIVSLVLWGLGIYTSFKYIINSKQPPNSQHQKTMKSVLGISFSKSPTILFLLSLMVFGCSGFDLNDYVVVTFLSKLVILAVGLLILTFLFLTWCWSKLK